jgi:hypothetical protein
LSSRFDKQRFRVNNLPTRAWLFPNPMSTYTIYQLACKGILYMHNFVIYFWLKVVLFSYWQAIDHLNLFQGVVPLSWALEL